MCYRRVRAIGQNCRTHMTDRHRLSGHMRPARVRLFRHKATVARRTTDGLTVRRSASRAAGSAESLTVGDAARQKMPMAGRSGAAMVAARTDDEPEINLKY